MKICTVIAAGLALGAATGAQAAGAPERDPRVWEAAKAARSGELALL